MENLEEELASQITTTAFTVYVMQTTGCDRSAALTIMGALCADIEAILFPSERTVRHRVTNGAPLLELLEVLGVKPQGPVQ